MCLSVMMRVVIKIITDYTGVVQFRGPGELGGLYWTFSIFSAIAAVFASAKIHFATIKEREELISEDAAWTVVCALGGAWAAIFVAFLVLIKRQYWETFISLKTGNERVQDYFLNDENSDELRADIVKFNRHLWTSIRGQVREWFMENWERWEEEEPDWFDGVFISRVDDDLLPVDVLEHEKSLGGGSRRRESFGDSSRSVLSRFGDSVRSSSKVAPA